MRNKIYGWGRYGWGPSSRRLIRALGDYYSRENVRIYFGHGCTERYLKSEVWMLNRHIERMSDKIVMNQKMDELKIRHPKTYYYPFDKLPSSKDKCVIKPRYGCRGKGISFSRFNKINKNNLSYNNYVQQFIPFEREYRVGIDWNRVLGIREKMGIAKIRNSKSCLYETRHIDELREFAWKVFKKFEVDFTGMDIGLWKGKYIVIELNSSPTIGEYWSRLLAEDLINLLYEKMEE